MTTEKDTPDFNLEELKLLPAWMKDDAPAPARDDWQEREFDRPGARQDRPGQDRPGRREFPRQDDRRGERRPGGGQGDKRPGGGPGDRRSGGERRQGGDRRAGDGRQERHSSQGPRPAPSAPGRPANVRIEFLPDPRALASIAKEIRSTHLAYPLFGLARMFVDRPERHLLKITAAPAIPPPGQPPGPEARPPASDPVPSTLYQCGEDGPVATERAPLEKIAFDLYKDRYYAEVVIQKDPPKGNYSAVARERQTGTLLGPTNYHAYQANLRALYESRFSRRMSFEDYRRDIEIVSDPALVERWKEEVRTVTTYTLKDTPEGQAAPVFNSLAEARQHFREHYLESLVRSGQSFEIPGPVGRGLPEPALMMALREAHEQEMKFPAGLVQPLRAGLQAAGLHVFKHRKRMVYVSAARPVPFNAGGKRGGAVSAGISAILEAVAESPLLNRKQLAQRVVEKRLAMARSTTAGPAVAGLSQAGSRESALAKGVENPVTAGPSTEGPAPAREELSEEDRISSGGHESPPQGETGVDDREQTTSNANVTDAETLEPPAAATTSEQTSPGIAVAETGAPPAEMRGEGNQQTTSRAAVPPAAPTAASADPIEEAIARAKAALPADLLYLMQAGHVVGFFHTGTFDLPLIPQPQQAPRGASPRAPSDAPNTAPAIEPAAEAAPPILSNDPEKSDARAEMGHTLPVEEPEPSADIPGV